ncbi:WD40 repeat-like protein [Piromyces finnis]|uniref:WD40 repeat-like protein n=1 Tax=Piromyces finnis TaxID=1754191 RepID=A0A1Y1V845_9FUNG|nr:WD40 repeat-like protein [Piromyces finnis]|eukprot:ORX49360.1 WD40 repeat-like protein [Piromyces finnis]
MDSAIISNYVSALKGAWKKSTKIDPEQCYILSLPEELIIKIFSYLDPDTLNIVSWVCSSWNKIIRNEIIWKEAFLDRFEYMPYEKVSEGRWREEFTTRMNLIDLWKRGKPNVLEYRCMYPIADIFYADFNRRRLYTGWLDQGIIIVSDPSTGRTERRNINLFGDFMPQPVSCVKIDKDHIFVGEFGGRITKISNFKDKLKNLKHKKYVQRHETAITCIEWLPTFTRLVVTGSADGRVMLWDTKYDARIAVLSSYYEAAITSIIINPKKYIIVGNIAGQVQIWNVNVFDLMSAKKPPEDGQELYLTMDYVIDVGSPIVSLHYDPIYETIIIACQNGSKDRKLTHWSIPQLKKLNILDDGDYSNELAVVTWSKEQQGKTSNIERAKLSGINIDTTKYNNNELHGLEESIIVSSDNNGMIYIWNFDNKKKTPNEDNEYSSKKLIRKDENGTNILTPLRSFNLHEGPPTSILIDAFKIVTAGSDGKVNVIDSLNSTLIRTFYCRKSKNNPRNTNVMRHYNVINGMEMDKYQICISFGNSIKVWDFDTERIKESKKKNKTDKELLSLKLARNKNIMEDYKTSCEMFEKEKKQEKVNSKNLKRFNGSINEELTEEELMAYAMMLSMEQKEQVISTSSKGQDHENEINDDFEYDPSQFNSDQEEIPEDYVDEQEKRDFLYASEIAKQDMYMEKINNEINHPEDNFKDQYYEDDDENENGISAEQYFKEEKIKQEERKKKSNINKSKPSFNTSGKSDNDFINDAIQDFLNDTPETSIINNTTSVTSSSVIVPDSSTNILNNKYDTLEDEPKSKGGKKGKGKKNKGKKKNFIPLDEWEENYDNYAYDNYDEQELLNISSPSPDNTLNVKNPEDMNEEEYLNYVLQLSLHDK